MKPKLHLLCNAHLDPVWLWSWQEGAAEAVSTFRTAADFCEKYDGFVFNHNEALLYEWIEEYEPELFERIKRLVAEGKWNILGGWYLQPDCSLPSGESFVRQIRAGREYFFEKFGVTPKTAVSFDAFGHTRGLVQILKKTGYDNYIFMRGPEDFPQHYLFKWEGFDGSRVNGHRIYGGYNTLKGKACEKVKSYIETEMKKPDFNLPSSLVTWGIGDHGGGASMPDVEDIEELIKTIDDIEIIQSGADNFFADVDMSNAPVFDKSLYHVMVGCYSSMAKIKQEHRRLENKIAFAEKIMSHAEYACGMKYDGGIKEAERALMFTEFHDILPGSMIKKGENDELGRMFYGETIADKLTMKAFYALCKGQKKPAGRDIPVMVYNPHPYNIKTEIETEYILDSQNWNDGEYTIGKVYDEEGNALPSQNIKTECTMNLDWRKQIAFSAELKPFSMNRFDIKLETLKDYRMIADYDEDAVSIIVKKENSEVKISKLTGLIESYKIGDKIYLENTGVIGAYKDNEDPWGMTVNGFNDFAASMELLTKEEANEFFGFKESEKENVRVIENGSVKTVIQAAFRYDKSYGVVTYTIPKNDEYIDIAIRLYSANVSTMYKYTLDTKMNNGEFYGQTAFGTQILENDLREVNFQEWCSLENDDKYVYVINKGTYAGSSDGSELRMTLLRTPIYAAHPIAERDICDKDRNFGRIDMGERDFSFRIVCSDKKLAIDKMSQEYNQPPMALAMFPNTKGEIKEFGVEVDNENIIMTSFANTKVGSLIRLYNSSSESQQAEFTICGKKHSISFGKFEVKTFRTDGEDIAETDMLGGRY